MATETVLVTNREDAITVITINRPHAKNAVDPHTARLLYEKFLAFEQDAAQKICVFHGENGTFCSGADLKAVAQSANGQPRSLQVSSVDGRNQGPMGPSRLQVKKPVIAAVAGYAVAGGLELSLVADMRIVEEDAVFGVFCRRWGVPLIDGGTVRLQAIVGYGRAME
jgi:enoyl-CoA hydratase/carnithine racemase